MAGKLDARAKAVAIRPLKIAALLVGGAAMAATTWLIATKPFAKSPDAVRPAIEQVNNVDQPMAPAIEHIHSSQQQPDPASTRGSVHPQHRGS